MGGPSPTGGPVRPADHSQTNWMSWLMAQRSSDEPMGTPSFAIRLDYFQRILPLGQLTREAHNQLRLVHWLLHHIVALLGVPSMW